MLIRPSGKPTPQAILSHSPRGAQAQFLIKHCPTNTFFTLQIPVGECSCRNFLLLPCLLHRDLLSLEQQGQAAPCWYLCGTPSFSLSHVFSLHFLSLGNRKPDFNHVYNENIYNLRFHRSHCYWFHMFHCCWYIKAQYQVLPIHDLWMIEMLNFCLNPTYFHCFEIWCICYASCWLCNKFVGFLLANAQS